MRVRFWISLATVVVVAFVVLAPTEEAAAGSRKARKAIGILGGIGIGGAILNNLPAIGQVPRVPRQGQQGKGGGKGGDDNAEGSVEERIAVQNALISLGYNIGEPNGKFGPKVRTAIRAWQKANGDEPTGRLTAKQRTALVPASLIPTPLPSIDPKPRPTTTAFRCDADGAWQRVRAVNPIHVQGLAKCENRANGQHVIVLTEPPPHLTRNNAEAIAKAFFGATENTSLQVHKKRHNLGFDGWVEDLVIVAEPRTAEETKALGDSLALLALYAFGSSYKAEVLDISNMGAAPVWEAPPAFEVTADELHAWLLGPNAKALAPLEGGPSSNLKALAERNETGVFQSVEPGLVVAIVPSGQSQFLNDYVDDLRRFSIDTDVFLGAMKLGSRVALIGRERTTSLTAMPPLRVESMLLLASERSEQLAQSYERRRPFAGKLLTGAGDLFGWDWAPILLSNQLIDTEFGSLLNFTDNMLKSWSESGKVEYKGWTHAKPASFPFQDAGAVKTLGTGRLTFNWNTAGVGYVSENGGARIFAVRNTGSLPVSYFPEGSEDNDGMKARLVEAEDKAYEYFSSLRNPLLERAVQYAALYQVFQVFDVFAKPPHDMAAKNAGIAKVEELLQKHVQTALEALSRPNSPSTDDLRLGAIYAEHGNAGSANLQLEEGVLRKVRSDIANEISVLDAEKTPAWRALYVKSLMREDGPRMVTREELRRIQEERRQVAEIEARLDKVKKEGWRLALPLDQVRRDVVASTDRDPQGWIKTPSIVVSRYSTQREVVGGHNIGGRATRIEIDATVARGQPRVTGDYEFWPCHPRPSRRCACRP